MDENKLIHKLIDLFKYKEQYQLNTSGLLPQDMYLLERIYFYGDSRVLEVAKNFGIAPSTLTGILNRLEKEGCIERIRSNQDRKLVKVSITSSGKDIVDRHIKEDEVFASRFFGGLQGQEVEDFKGLLAKLLSNIDKNTIFTQEGE